MSSREIAAFLFGASAILIVRALLSAALRYWCHARPLNKRVREDIRACVSANVKPLWSDKK